jgi:hypothetical protein
VHLAAQMGWPMNHFTAALNERNGPPIRYWRLGTRLGDGPFIWPAMRDGSPNCGRAAISRHFSKPARARRRRWPR